MKKYRTLLFLSAFFVVLIGAFMWYVFPKIREHEDKKSKLPVYGNNESHRVAPFSFTNQDGKVITNDDVKGKVCVVEYFFATCPGICPKMNQNLSKVYQAFKGNKNVLILSHTVDPYKDTVAALKAYSLRFDADASQWMFLTGDKKKLYDMARYSYLISAGDDTAGLSIDKDFIHDKHYVLVDGFGRVRGFYDGLLDADVNKMITDIGTLLKEDERK